MVYIWIGICAFFLLFSYMIYRDLSVPPVPSGLIWIIQYIMMLLSKTFYLSSRYIGCFAIAYACFCFGFFVANPKIRKSVKIYENNIDLNIETSRYVILLEYLISILYIYTYRNEIFSQDASLWMAIQNSKVETNYFFKIFTNMFPVVSDIYMYICLKKPQNIKYFLITLIPLVVVMFTSTRMTWFYVISAFILIIIYAKNFSNQQIAILSLAGLIVICAIFSVSSLTKYSNIVTNISDFEKLEYYYKIYFLSPSLAFLQWMDSGSFFSLGYGRYTFRFFLVLLNTIFPKIDVPNTVMPFTVVDGMRTNVYTILHWYAMDFGLMWAYTVQIFLGIFLGKLYKRVKGTSLPKCFDTIMISMFMSVIFGQFFCDTLFTHSSLWLQRTFWCYLFCKILIIN